jgi:hypothetical protein
VQREDQLRGCGGQHVLAIELRQIALRPPQPLDVTVERCGWPVLNYRHGTNSIQRNQFERIELAAGHTPLVKFLDQAAHRSPDLTALREIGTVGA